MGRTDVSTIERILKKYKEGSLSSEDQNNVEEAFKVIYCQTISNYRRGKLTKTQNKQIEKSVLGAVDRAYYG